MNKITVQDKYTGYAGFTPRRAGVLVFKLEKYLKIARVYKVKSGAKKDNIELQKHRHGAVEKKMHQSNDWLSLPPDLILPLIKILQEWYVELHGEEVPENMADFKDVSKEKELTKDIDNIGL